MAYFYRGFSFEKQGQIDQAIDDFQKTVALKSDFLLGLTSLAKLYAKKQDFPKAAEWYKKAYELGVTDANAIFNYGVSLINQGKNNEAREVLEKLLALNPDYADGYYQLGIVYLGMNDMAKSKEFLNKFLQLDPQNQNASLAQKILETLK
jgi:tetratricopeptide (TPR) repeat protein